MRLSLMMFGFKRDKERERFYLLPGMGGRAYRRKQNLFLKISILVGLIVGGALAAVIWFLYVSAR